MNTLISPKRLEHRTSYYTCIDERGYDISARIDKISLVLYVTSDEARAELSCKLDNLNSNHIFNITHSRSNKIYEYGLTIRYKGTGNHSKYLKIEYGQRFYKPNNSYMRIETSPQCMTTEEINNMLDWLFREQVVGALFKSALMKAYVTRIDFAVDIEHLSANDYLIDLTSVRTGEVYNNADLPGLRLGAYNSNMYISNYDKLKLKSNVKTKPKRIKRDVVSINPDNYTPITRIELRYQIKTMSAELLFIPNMLRDVKFFDRAKILRSRTLPREFKDALDSLTIPQAKRVFSGNSRTARRTRRQISRTLARNEIQVLNKRKVWSIWSTCLGHLGKLIPKQECYNLSL